ncbi:MAG: hypothetical protein IPP83_00510 [Flavobacteriales bacterium]|nr:hypothetical protein [Flavobacteriales bacterium]
MNFRVKVKEAIGVAKMKVTVSGAGESASEKIELQVRQPNLPATEVTEALLDANKDWSATPTPLGVQGTNAAYLEVSTIPPVDMGRRLQYLLDYPHGCLEQTTSKAFPQLFIAKVMELPARGDQMARSNVEAALRKMSQFQRNDGGFNYWPGGDYYDNWTSIYAGHFIVEAERAGYAVPGNVKSNWLSFQRKQAREWNGVVPEGWSRQGTLPAMNRLREQSNLGLQAKWMLAAAYAYVGRKDVAQAIVKGVDTTIPAYTEQYWTYGSDLRDEALVAEALLAMGETERAAPVVQRISRRLSSEGWYSTQSTAFGLLAVARLAEKSQLGKRHELHAHRGWQAHGEVQRESDLPRGPSCAGWSRERVGIEHRQEPALCAHGAIRHSAGRERKAFQQWIEHERELYAHGRHGARSFADRTRHGLHGDGNGDASGCRERLPATRVVATLPERLGDPQHAHGRHARRCSARSLYLPGHPR